MDPLRLQAANLTLAQVTDALSKNNQITPTGMHEENHTLYLAVVDGRVHNISEIEDLIVSVANSRPVRIKDFARVEQGPEPAFQVVTAEGVPAVLLNVRSQPDGSTMDIANGLKRVMEELKRELPPRREDRLFLRPIALRARVGRQRLGRDSFRTDSLGGHHLSFPEELGHDAHRHRRDSGHRADHAPGHEGGWSQPEYHDAGRASRRPSGW